MLAVIKYLSQINFIRNSGEMTSFHWNTGFTVVNLLQHRGGMKEIGYRRYINRAVSRLFLALDKNSFTPSWRSLKRLFGKKSITVGEHNSEIDRLRGQWDHFGSGYTSTPSTSCTEASLLSRPV